VPSATPSTDANTGERFEEALVANDDHIAQLLPGTRGERRTATFFIQTSAGRDLSEVNVSEANLYGANLILANLTNAIVRGADLQTAALVNTILSGADLNGCRIYGISAWNLRLEGTNQQNLVITQQSEPEITIDNIEVGQFIYLLLHNEKIRHVIDTITSKVVLILGRFTPQRKAVLDAPRGARRRDYLPILFDFEKPVSRDITESLLARMARFVLADITDAKSIPQELNVIVPDLPSVPVQPLLLRGLCAMV
jgi:uncharacterized protein YjbI with pentapeptide repeats